MPKHPFLALRAALMMINESLPGRSALIASPNFEQKGSVWHAVGLIFQQCDLEMLGALSRLHGQMKGLYVTLLRNL